MTKTIKVSDLKPLAGFVLVEPAEAQTKTASGIYLPESGDEKPQYGKVLACGDAIYDDGVEIKCPVKKKDQVLYKKWGGNEFKIADKEYQFLKFEDLIAVIG
ncbi:MAG: co-chaperone GroES [Patescibacteria group bacterium]